MIPDVKWADEMVCHGFYLEGGKIARFEIV
jgi:hypothetical protein